MLLFLCVYSVVLGGLLILFSWNVEDKRQVLILGVVIVGLLAVRMQFSPLLCFPGGLFLILPPGSETVRYDGDLPEEGKELLKDCFGENMTLSEGVEKEYGYFDEHDQVNVTIHYTEWTLSYTDVQGQSQSFVFDNRWQEFGRGSMESAVEMYFSHQAEDFYRKNFWDKTLAAISGIQEDDSMIYLDEYSDSDLRRIPEASAIVEKMECYSLTENLYFPELQYQEVFGRFPYVLRMYLYADYEGDGEKERSRQRQETEEILRQMTEEMISCTNHSLNAMVGVTMMDENGCADRFHLAVLGGEYFTGGGEDYEIALCERFFGKPK